MLQFDEVRKLYRARGAEHLALDGVSFEAHPGEIIGLLGPNGAGKTTLIKCACGLIRPTSGQILAAGFDTTGQRRHARRHVAVVFEGARNLYGRLTARENLEFFAALYGIYPWKARPRANALLERLSLGPHAHHPVHELSRGMQQKLAIACALIRPSRVLLLDEPTLGLDVNAGRDLRAMLAELSRQAELTTLLSSHDMAVVESICARVTIIQRGRLVADQSTSDLLAAFSLPIYEFEVSELPRGSALESLRREFVSLDWTVAPPRLRVELKSREDFYRFVARLHEAGLAIHSALRPQPNLEDVFQRITSEGPNP